MKYVFFAFIIIGGIQQSCNFCRSTRNSKSEIIERPDFTNFNEFMEIAIRKERIKFGTLMDHIPDKLYNLEAIYSTGSYCCDDYVNFFTLLVHLGSEDTLIEHFKRLSVAEYEAYDTCNFVLFKTTYQTQAFPNSLLKDIEKYDKVILFGSYTESRFPIPNFLERDTADIDEEILNQKLFSFESGCHLDETFKLYILDAAPGIHHDIQNNDFSIEGLGKWSKGYSKGVAISEQKNSLFYWVIVW